MKLRAIRSYNSIITTIIALAIYIAFYLFLAFMYIVYVIHESIEYNWQTFFEWALYTSDKNPAFSIILFLAFLGIIAIPVLIIYQIMDCKKFNQGLNIKSIDFFPKALKVNYTVPKHDFICDYSQISEFHINIDTVIVDSRYHNYVACGVFTLEFRNKQTRRTTTFEFQPLMRAMPTLYKIVDFTRRISNFELTFSGRGEIGDIKEKVEKYRKYGYKDALGKTDASNYLQVGWMFFGAGYLVSLILICATVPSDIAFMGISAIPLVIFCIVALCFDIALIKDRLNDNKFAQIIGEVQKPINKLALGAIIKIVLPVITFLIIYLYFQNNL